MIEHGASMTRNVKPGDRLACGFSRFSDENSPMQRQEMIVARLPADVAFHQVAADHRL
jgi:hypothetical protein